MGAPEIGNFILGVGVIVACISVASVGRIARKKETALLLFHSRGDRLLQRGHSIIRARFRANDQNIQSLAADYESIDAKLVRYVLNHFETLSVGIQAKIYDEKMLKQCWCSIVIGTFDETHSLITAIRQRDGSSTVYQEFEWLAQRWKKKKLLPKL